MVDAVPAAAQGDASGDALFQLEAVLDPAIDSASSSSSSAAAAAAAVRCAEGHGPHLYIGTSDGSLLWYTLSGQTSSSKAAPTYTLANAVTISTAGKPVEKVILCPTIGVAVVLCESIVTFYELPNLQPIPPTVLPHIKAVATVVQDDAELGNLCDDGSGKGMLPSPGALVSLCIIKRKQIFLVRIGRDQWIPIKEVPLPGGASIARRYGDQLCIATAAAYSLVNLADSTILPLGLPISQTNDSPSAHVRPSILAVRTASSSTRRKHGHASSHASGLPTRRGGSSGANDDASGCEFLITSHSEAMTLGVFVRPNGEPAPKIIEWPSHPRALVMDGQRVVSLLRNDTIEVHDLDSMSKLGTSLSVPAELEPRFVVSALTSSLPSTSSPTPAALADEGVVWLCGKNAVHKVSELPLLKRGQRLLVQGQWEALRSLADGAWERVNLESIEVTSRGRQQRLQAQMRDIQKMNQELGLHFLEQTNFALARRYLSRGKVDARLVIGLFKDVRRHVLDDEDGADTELTARLKGVGMRELSASWRSIEEIVRANLQHNYCPPLDIDSDKVLQKLAEALLERAQVDLLRGFLVDCRQQRRTEQREGRLGMDELTWRRMGMIIDVVLAKVYASIGDLDELLAILSSSPGGGGESDHEDLDASSLQVEVERALRQVGQHGLLAGLLLKKGDQNGAMETLNELLARQDDPAVRAQIDLLLDSPSIKLDLYDTLTKLGPASEPASTSSGGSDWDLATSPGLTAFLRRALVDQLHSKHEASIVRALALAQNLDVAERVWGTMSAQKPVRRAADGTHASHGRGGGDAGLVEDAGVLGLNGKEGWTVSNGEKASRGSRGTRFGTAHADKESPTIIGAAVSSPARGPTLNGYH